MISYKDVLLLIFWSSTCICTSETAIAETIDFIEQTSKRGQHCISIFLDVDGAFNKTNLDGVVKAMRENDYPDTFVDWYEAFKKHTEIFSNSLK